MEFLEVWNVTSQQLNNNSYMTFFIVGILFIVIETIALFSRKKWGVKSSLFVFLNSVSHPQYPAYKIFIPIGIISIFFGSVNYLNIQKNITGLEKNWTLISVDNTELFRK